MLMKFFVCSGRWRASSTNPIIKANLPILATVVAMLQLTGNQAMSQPNCDVVEIAKDYVKAHFPFIDTAPDRRVVSLPVGDFLQITFKLPEGYLGFVPEITVDPRTCQVVRAKVWQ